MDAKDKLRGEVVFMLEFNFFLCFNVESSVDFTA